MNIFSPSELVGVAYVFHFQIHSIVRIHFDIGMLFIVFKKIRFSAIEPGHRISSVHQLFSLFLNFCYPGDWSNSFFSCSIMFHKPSNRIVSHSVFFLFLISEVNKCTWINQCCRAGVGAGTGAVISYFGSGSAAEMIFLIKILVILLYSRQFGGCQDE